jgi:hypothetical protein
MEVTWKGSKFLADEPEGNGAVGRDRHGWEDNIKMGSKDIGYGWILLANDGVKWSACVSMVMNLWIHLFIHGLFRAAVSSLDYIASNGGMITE